MNLNSLKRNSQRSNPPIFKAVFAQDWARLPKVMQDRYAVRPYSDDLVVVEGTLDIEVSAFMKMISRFSGMLISRAGRRVPVTVRFRSGKDTADFFFDRIFHYPAGDQRFLSRMVYLGGRELIEFMGFGIGWKMAYAWDGEKVVLSHRGYVWRILGIHIPLPLHLIIGKGEAAESPVSDDEFAMWTHSMHSWFGASFAYSGKFKITEVKCRDPS